MSNGGSSEAISGVLSVLRGDLQAWLDHARETYTWGADAELALTAPGKLLATATSSTRIPQGFWALLSYEVACYCAPSSHEVARFRRLAVACELLLCSLDYFDELEDNDSSATRLALGDGRLLNCSTALYQQGLQILAELDDTADHLAPSLRLFSIASSELSLAMSGQHLDLLSEQQPWDGFDVEKCISIIAAKSGSLCRMVCRLACAVAGADAQICALFAEIGTNIGIAAQLENDIHSMEQSLEEEPNQPLEKTDVLRAKKTLPLVLAFKSTLQKPTLSADTTDHEGQDQYGPVQVYRDTMQQTWASALFYRFSASAHVESIEQLLGRPLSPRMSTILGIDIEAC